MRLFNFAFSKRWRTWIQIASLPLLVLTLYGIFSGSLFWMVFPVSCVVGVGLFEDAIKAVAYKHYSCKHEQNSHE